MKRIMEEKISGQKGSQERISDIMGIVPIQGRGFSFTTLMTNTRWVLPGPVETVPKNTVKSEPNSCAERGCNGGSCHFLEGFHIGTQQHPESSHSLLMQRVEVTQLIPDLFLDISKSSYKIKSDNIKFVNIPWISPHH